MKTIDISTPSGRLRGELRPEGAVFRGVPFALPPYGELRFRPPQRVPAWDGVRDAIEVGAAVPQAVLDATAPGHTYFNPTVHGEDCLNLQVWTPDPSSAGLPVMVWIHGGGFEFGGGAAPLHDGATWARDGVVHVSINYRLHVEGFLHLDGAAPNLGLQDMVAALQWVREHIAAFGGDPGNVTIFGESGGAVGVMHLLAMPSAAGLFRRAIAQSGSTRASCDDVFEARVVARLSELLGVPGTVDGFASVPQERLLAVMGSIAVEYLSPALWGADAFLISPFRPLVDGVVLPAEPETAVRGGASGDVDLLVGTCRDETTFAMQPLGMLGVADVPELWANMALDAFGVTWDDLEAYRKATRPNATKGDLITAAWTDWAFRIPSLRLLEAHSPHPGGTYCYEFAWPSVLPHLGAVHSLEIPFVNDGLTAFSNAFEPAFDQIGPDAPQALADRMHADWIRFASTGDPGWPQYDTASRATMRYDTTCEVVDDLAGIERLWEGRP